MVNNGFEVDNLAQNVCALEKGVFPIEVKCAVTSFFAVHIFKEFDVTDEVDQKYILYLLGEKCTSYSNCVDVMDTLYWCKSGLNYNGDDVWAFIRSLKGIGNGK